jgi:uncharacterized membrane protein
MPFFSARLAVKLRAKRMKRIWARFTIHQLMLAVAILGLLAYNATLIERICLSSNDVIRASGFVGPVRVFCFTVLASIVGSLLGCFSLLVVWRSTSTSVWPGVRGAITGVVASFLAWFVALILLFIGYGVDGQAPLSALLLSMLGAALNILPAALIGICWAWLTRRPDQGARR